MNNISVTPKLLEIARKVGPIKSIFECGSRDALDGLRLLEELNAEQLHSFECNPQAIELCRKNIAASRFAHSAFVVPKAVSDTTGILRFYSIDPDRTITPHSDGNIGASSLYKADPSYPHEKYVQKAIEVESTSIDAYCEEHQAPDLLWMDLQGAEAKAIDGAQRTLSKVKVIHVEVSFRSMYLDQALFGDIHNRLKKQFCLVNIDLGRWPKLPWLYSMLKVGPWVGNAIYVNKNLKWA